MEHVVGEAPCHGTGQLNPRLKPEICTKRHYQRSLDYHRPLDGTGLPPGEQGTPEHMIMVELYDLAHGTADGGSKAGEGHNFPSILTGVQDPQEQEEEEESLDTQVQVVLGRPADRLKTATPRGST